MTFHRGPGRSLVALSIALALMTAGCLGADDDADDTDDEPVDTQANDTDAVMDDGSMDDGNDTDGNVTTSEPAPEEDEESAQPQPSPQPYTERAAGVVGYAVAVGDNTTTLAALLDTPTFTVKVPAGASILKVYANASANTTNVGDFFIVLSDPDGNEVVQAGAGTVLELVVDAPVEGDWVVEIRPNLVGVDVWADVTAVVHGVAVPG